MNRLIIIMFFSEINMLYLPRKPINKVYQFALFEYKSHLVNY